MKNLSIMTCKTVFKKWKEVLVAVVVPVIRSFRMRIVVVLVWSDKIQRNWANDEIRSLEKLVQKFIQKKQSKKGRYSGENIKGQHLG